MSWLKRRSALRLVLLFGIVLILIGLATPQVWAWHCLRSAKAELTRYHPEDAARSLAACQRVWDNSATVRLLASRAARQSGDFVAADSELRVPEAHRRGHERHGVRVGTAPGERWERA